MKEGTKVRLKNINSEQIASMNLEWMWEPGEVVTLAQAITGKPYHGMNGEPASMVRRSTGRNIWIYNEYLTGLCIWE